MSGLVASGTPCIMRTMCWPILCSHPQLKRRGRGSLWSAFCWTQMSMCPPPLNPFYLLAGAHPVPKPACFSEYGMIDTFQKSFTKCKLQKEPQDRVANIFWLWSVAYRGRGGGGFGGFKPPPNFRSFISRTGLQIERKMFSVPIPTS
jgi:hypothetical protein